MKVVLTSRKGSMHVTAEGYKFEPREYICPQRPENILPGHHGQTTRHSKAATLV